MLTFSSQFQFWMDKIIAVLFSFLKKNIFLIYLIYSYWFIWFYKSSAPIFLYSGAEHIASYRKGPAGRAKANSQFK